MDSTKKYPVNASGVRDGLSGDMLASSRRYLVLLMILKFTIFKKILSTCIMNKIHSEFKL